MPCQLKEVFLLLSDNCSRCAFRHVIHDRLTHFWLNVMLWQRMMLTAKTNTCAIVIHSFTFYHIYNLFTHEVIYQLQVINSLEEIPQEGEGLQIEYQGYTIHENSKHAIKNLMTYVFLLPITKCIHIYKGYTYILIHMMHLHTQTHAHIYILCKYSNIHMRKWYSIKMMSIYSDTILYNV